MDIATLITALASLLTAIAAVSQAAILFWREMRRDSQKRPRK